MSLAEIATIVLPVFALIAVGAAATRTRLLSAAGADGIADFVYVLAIPVLIFRTLATAVLPPSPPWGLWLAYFTGVGVAWTIGAVSARRVFGLSGADAVIAGVTASFSNLVLMGVPLTLTAYGEAGTVPLFLLISIHLPVMMVAGTLSIEAAVRRDGTVATPFAPGRLLVSIARNLATNPIVYGILAGGLVRWLGWPVTGVFRQVVDMIAAAAVPCSLIALGAAVSRYGLTGTPGLTAVNGLAKLVVMPATVFVTGTFVFGVPPLWVAVATLAAACPSGINSYLIASRFRTGQAVASAGIGVTTLVSIVTLWIALDWIGRP